MKRRLTSNAVSWFDRGRVECIVRLIYDNLPIAEEDALIERAMQAYDCIRAAYDTHHHYNKSASGVCRCTKLNNKGTTIVIAVAVVALVEALSSAQYDTYVPIYSARRKAVNGAFFNDVHHLLRDNDLRLVDYAGVRDAAIYCMENSPSQSGQSS